MRSGADGDESHGWSRDSRLRGRDDVGMTTVTTVGALRATPVSCPVLSCPVLSAGGEGIVESGQRGGRGKMRSLMIFC